MTIKPIFTSLLFLLYSVGANAQWPSPSQADILKYHIKSITEVFKRRGKVSLPDTLAYKKFDEAGNLVYNKDANQIYTYQYDEKNNLLKYEYFSKKDKAFRLRWFDTYQRDAAGRDSIQKHFFTWGRMFPDNKENDIYESSEERRKYDSLGNVIEYGYYSDSGKMVHIINYTYDGKGHVIAEKTKEGSNIYVDFSFEYDSLGNITKEVTYNSGDRCFGNIDEYVPGETRETRYEYEYDNKKRVVEKRLYYNNERSAYMLWKYSYYNNDSVREASAQVAYLPSGQYHVWLYHDKTQRLYFTITDSSNTDKKYIFAPLNYQKFDILGNELIYVSHDYNSILNRGWDEEYTKIGKTGKPRFRRLYLRTRIESAYIIEAVRTNQHFEYYSNGLLKSLKNSTSSSKTVFLYEFY